MNISSKTTRRIICSHERNTILHGRPHPPTRHIRDDVVLRIRALGQVSVRGWGRGENAILPASGRRRRRRSVSKTCLSFMPDGGIVKKKRPCRTSLLRAKRMRVYTCRVRPAIKIGAFIESRCSFETIIDSKKKRIRRPSLLICRREKRTVK